ncbi:MAG TPA: DNA topoisomerase I [Methanocorpusculum sp.]|nr:DNA topoisomerase I [Methanocorpusculum sp.]
MHLIIAEKNIVAERIAAFLSSPQEKVQQKRDGNVVQYLVGDNIVMGLRGHVVELDFEKGYANWRSAEHPPRSLIDAGIITEPTEKKIVGMMQSAARKCSRVTIATDFDREGELIGKEAVELIKQVNAKVPIYRARFSAITKDEILTSIRDARGLDENLAASGKSRQIIDLVWGASLTRFLTLAAHRSAGNVLSVGRVQSPTLAMIVDREREIEAFVPEKYWMLTLKTAKGSDSIEARHVHGRFTNKVEAKAAYEATKEPLTVTEVITGKKTDRAPTPLDTTALIVGAGRLGISAASAMNRAEELYMNGFISYPRTDNTTYPKSLDITEQLNVFAHGYFKEDVVYVKEHRRPVPTRGKKETTDHPPIYPTGTAVPQQMDPVTWKLYEFIVRRFLATVSIDAEWETMKVNLSAAGEPYTATGGRLLVPGWKKVYPYSKAEENILPIVSVGERLLLTEKDMEEKETKPPARYSQSALVQRMEELGLGTKSTRADVITKLMGRKYIEGNPMKPTLIGRAVTETLEEYAETITAPAMTQTLEVHMQDIAAGTKQLDAVLSESRSMLSEIFDSLEKNEKSIGDEIMNRTRETDLLGPCPVCGKPLQIKHIGVTKQFIGCTGYPDCTFNVGLPPTMWGYAVKTDEICEKHGVHHINLIRKGAAPWKFGCPVCNHIDSNKELLQMIPQMNDAFIDKLYAVHLYSVYDIAAKTVDRLAELLSISKAEAELLQIECEKIQITLKKRAELKKFVTPYIGFRKGRSKSKIIKALFDTGCSSLADLSVLSIETLLAAKFTEDEATKLLADAARKVNLDRMKEAKIPAVTLKKYDAAGFANPERFVNLPVPQISKETGVSEGTVTKHQKLVREYLG